MEDRAHWNGIRSLVVLEPSVPNASKKYQMEVRSGVQIQGSRHPGSLIIIALLSIHVPIYFHARITSRLPRVVGWRQIFSHFLSISPYLHPHCQPNTANLHYKRALYFV